MLQWIIIGISLLLFITGVSFGVMSFLHEPGETNSLLVLKNKINADTDTYKGSKYLVGEQVINLYSPNTRLRFLKIVTEVESAKIEKEEDLKKFDKTFKDIMIDIVSNSSPDDLSDVSGRDLLRAKFIKRVNQKVGFDLISKVYFREYLIQ